VGCSFDDKGIVYLWRMEGIKVLNVKGNRISEMVSKRLLVRLKKLENIKIERKLKENKLWREQKKQITKIWIDY
jgi:hypothetical protein